MAHEGLTAIIIMLVIVMAALYLFFEVLGFTPSPSTALAGAGSSH